MTIYHKRTNTYSGCGKRWTFNPDTLEAYSYDWWCMLKVINGKLVLNTWDYSVSTRNHRKQLREVLDSLGIKPDYFINAPAGLQSYASFNDLTSRSIVSNINATLKALYDKEAKGRPASDASFRRRTLIEYQKSMKRSYFELMKIDEVVN